MENQLKCSMTMNKEEKALLITCYNNWTCFSHFISVHPYFYQWLSRRDHLHLARKQFLQFPYPEFQFNRWPNGNPDGFLKILCGRGKVINLFYDRNKVYKIL